MTYPNKVSLFRKAKELAEQVFLPYQGAERRAVLSGVGIVTPVGDTVDALCDLAMSGQPGFTPIKRFKTDWCETDLACAFDPKDDIKSTSDSLQRKWMDRAVWYLLDALDRALSDAGIDLKSYDPERIAIVLGTSHSGLVTTEDLFWADMAGELEDEDPRRVLAIPASHICSAVAVATGAKGIRRTISSACASSTGAMGIAADLIRSGKADIVITGGTDTVSLAVTAGFNSLRALAKDGCQPFSSTPGITLGEGAGVFILERLDQAIGRDAPIQAEILGYALSGDAHHATAPDDNGDGIQRVLLAALEDAQVSPEHVDYLSAHGTGTDANDIAESRATHAVFGKRVPLSTPKSIFGHMLGASGVIETALTLGMAARGMIPPTLGFAKLRDGCEQLDYVPGAARAQNIETFVCNNYGFGGNNASVVLRRRISRPVKGASKDVKTGAVFISGASTVNAVGKAGPAGLVETVFSPFPTRKTVLRTSDDRLPKAFRRQVGRTSPMVKFAISATGEALQVAGLDDAELRGDTGLIYAVVTGAQKSTEKYMESVTLLGPERASTQHFPHTTNNAPGGQVSICYGLKGYNTTLCGAAGGMGLAMELVENGRQNRVVCAAADEHSDMLERFYDHAGLLSQTPVQPFDGQAGINFGEGGAAILFESAASLRERKASPMAEVLAYSEAQDGTLAGINRRGDALTRAISNVLKQASVDAADIDVIVAAGSGPGYFTRAEKRALSCHFDLEKKTVLSPVNVAGFGPAHTPLLMIGAAASIVFAEALPDQQTARLALVAGIDITGVAFAAVISQVEEF
jgi:3-oxoacyl-[acyl-carrier-protein] synthase II